MGFQHSDSGIAASIFFALYTIYCAFMVYIIYKKGFKTVYSFLITFPVFRFGSQLCGMVFSIVGFEHWQWLIAYLVLGAEGYFVLILCSFTFVTHAQKLEFGHSWVTDHRLHLLFLPFVKSYSSLFHFLLIPANSLVIAGGTMLTGVDDLDAEKSKVDASKAMRTTGQTIFLMMTVLVLVFASYAYKKERVRNHFNITVLFACPFLVVRGIFGILSIYIEDMNYFQFSNYSASGINHKLVVYEYVLSTTMEFVASMFILSNFFLDKSKNKQDVESLDSCSLDQAFVDSEKH